MTLNIKPVVQPISNSSAGTLRQVLQESWVNRTDIAAAYITNGGVRDVVSAMKETEGKGWKNIKKRWLTSFDYCRTEPLALEILSSVPNSQVRVHNAYAVLANNGIKLPVSLLKVDQVPEGERVFKVWFFTQP